MLTFYKQLMGTSRAAAFPPRQVAGFAMIEVLVALLVFALAIFAAAGMLLTALRTSQLSSAHSNALDLAIDIAEVMRANPVVMHSPDGQNPFLQLDVQAHAALALSPPSASCFQPESDCTPLQLAAFELYEWQQHLATSLPTGRAKISRALLQWRSGGDGGGDDGGEAPGMPCWDGADSGCSGEGDASGYPVVVKIGWQSLRPHHPGERPSPLSIPAIVIALAPDGRAP